MHTPPPLVDQRHRSSRRERWRQGGWRLGGGGRQRSTALLSVPKAKLILLFLFSYISICCRNIITIFYVTAPSCNPEREICRKCGEAPIEVAGLSDNSTREVQATIYNLNGDVTGEDTRIIGGDKASPLEYPYQVFITNNRKGRRSVNCGGSIITRDWVVTAAHCMIPPAGDFSDMVVGVGSNFRDLLEYLSVSQVIIHEKYDSLRIQDGNDIALIQLAKKLNFKKNPSVQPVCLAEAEDLVIGQDMVNTGWGLLNPSANSIPNALFEVSLTPMDVKICTYFTEIPRMQKSVICTINDGKSNCQGDSGGPLVAQLCDGRWVLAGISSYGESGCTQPRVFTSVSYYKDWILSNIKPSVMC
ncbi:chymotrypsin B-like [Scylla paramamosain]|uniref:chymotrypsin B-like n=1 Tax=Scylla paramamosain TaxID=85552 RepID=UPI00308280D7